MNKRILLSQIEEILSSNKDSKYYLVTMLSNISSILYHEMENTNWLGFYINEDDDKLVLGPFQGKVACMTIPYGKGVCGTCLKEKKTINVNNVHNFGGHIACDADSNSELVVPIIVKNKVRLVLDIDSPILNRFTEEDEHMVENVCELIKTSIEHLY